MGRPRKGIQEAEGESAKRAVIYARVSTKEQEEGFSIDAQLGLLRLYALERGFQVVREYVEAETAKTTGRSQFGLMVRALSAREASAIIVEKTDRIYRNLKDRVTIDELGVELHLVKENTVLSKDSRSHEKFVHDIKLVVAKNYCDNLSEEASKGMREKARQGFWPTNAPMGYMNVARGAKRIIEPDPKYMPMIQKLFESYATGEFSMKTAAKAARTLGLRTKRGNLLQASAVHIILQNPIYIGLIRWCGEIYPGQHEPIIDRATFEKVQKVLSGRIMKNPVQRAAQFAYKGLFKCGVCGCSMTPYLAKGTYIYYACTGYKGCRRVGIREDLISDQIAIQLEGLTIKPELLLLLKQALKESFEEQSSDNADRLQLLGAEQERLARQLERLYLDRVVGNVPERVYPDLKARWEDELDQVETAIADCKRANRATWEDNVAMLDLVSNSAQTFISARAERRGSMLRNLVSNSVITCQKVSLEFRPWFKLVLEANAETVDNCPTETILGKWSG